MLPTQDYPAHPGEDSWFAWWARATDELSEQEFAQLEFFLTDW